jgi:hypothetical protein
MTDEQIENHESNRRQRYAVHRRPLQSGYAPYFAFIDAQSEEEALALARSRYGKKVHHVKLVNKSNAIERIEK